jgi:hypothetical protein
MKKEEKISQGANVTSIQENTIVTLIQEAAH